MSKLSFIFDKKLKVYGWCDKHGNTEFSLPDDNFYSYCKACGTEGFDCCFGSFEKYLYKSNRVLRITCGESITYGTRP